MRKSFMERIVTNDLTDFEEWTLAVIPILIMLTIIFVAYNLL